MSTVARAICVTTPFLIYDLAVMSADGLDLQEMCSSKRSPKRRFGQETRPKCRALGKILIHVQTLDSGKGPLENVLSFPNLNFSLDKENPHRWRCSKSMRLAEITWRSET
jgi:hypothetical protein